MRWRRMHHVFFYEIILGRSVDVLHDNLFGGRYGERIKLIRLRRGRFPDAPFLFVRDGYRNYP